MLRQTQPERGSAPAEDSGSGSDKRAREDSSCTPDPDSASSGGHQQDVKRTRVDASETEATGSSLDFASSASPPTLLSFQTGHAARVSDEAWTKYLCDNHGVDDILFRAEDGDLTLVIVGGWSRTVSVWESSIASASIVNANKLNEVFPTWSFLIARTYEPKAHGHFPVAELVSSTPRVFHYLVAAAHNEPLPNHFSLEELRDIARLSHRFQALPLIAKYVRGWMSTPIDTALLMDDSTSEYCHQLEYLWCAYEFGMPDLFRRCCFNLAYVAKSVFRACGILPPGVHSIVYQRREAYIMDLVRPLRDYLEDLQEALTPGSQVSPSICSHQPEATQCAVEQFRLLMNWLRHEKLETISSPSFQAFQGRSPIAFFRTKLLVQSPTIRHLNHSSTCGLARLVREHSLDTDGRTALLYWGMAKGAESRPLSREHDEYMAKQEAMVPS